MVFLFIELAFVNEKNNQSKRRIAKEKENHFLHFFFVRAKQDGNQILMNLISCAFFHFAMIALTSSIHVCMQFKHTTAPISLQILVQSHQ